MKVEKAGDLMYVTYFMVKWEEEEETPARRGCAQCGQEMGKVEATVAGGDAAYEGLVCHDCKRVVWVRKA